MSKPFDATMRELFELEPTAWLEFLGSPVSDPSPVKVIDSNVSTVTADADKVVWVEGADPLIVHTEFLSGRDLKLPRQGELIEGVANMVLGIRGIEESWVYQDIFAKGSLDEARQILLSLGRKRWGEPDQQVLTKVATINLLDRLNFLLDRILDASSWDDLLSSLDEPPGPTD